MITISPPQVTDEDVAFYREHGWWVSPPFLAEDLLDTLKFGVQRYLAGERDWALPVNLGDGEAAAAPVRQTDYLSLQIEEFRRAVHDQAIPKIATRLAGTTAVRLFHDQLVTKPPFDAERKAVVGWHTDRAYWQTCTSSNMLTAWIPLDDVPEAKGPLAVWDGSHHWPDVETLHSFDRHDLGSIEDMFLHKGLTPDIIFLPMKRGQVSFHHCRLVHGGLENRSDEPRYGYAIHMQDAENRYGPTLSTGRRGHVNDLLCRRGADGNPDYSDPDIFPRLWP
jgi:Phytanoyl-CoA dioxygenase (PhyH)